MAQFKVGDVVTCVEAGNLNPENGGIWDAPLVVGGVYTVAQVGGKSWIDGRPSLWLIEVSNICPISGDVGFLACRFRLIKPPSIEWAHEIVRKVGKRGKVSA